MQLIKIYQNRAVFKTSSTILYVDLDKDAQAILEYYNKLAINNL